MPRKNHPREYVRAYHRASAILRERYLDEWNEIRLQLLDELLKGREPEKLSPGPKKGEGVARGWLERRAVILERLQQDNQALRDGLFSAIVLLKEAQEIIDPTHDFNKDSTEAIQYYDEILEETKGL